MIKQIATVAVYVEDQQKAKEFWTEKAGFVAKAEHPMGPNAFWLEVGPEGAETNLVIYPRAMMPNANELKPSIVFVCDDIQETYKAMAEKGVKFKEELKQMQWGTFAIFEDLDGNEYVLKG
ncbi:VOC family protein [Effusibacillus lacus]|uniref:VOC domain-containing protein n=1 Tax=Effusibacillus lacus TaxID=1348429 RepID=A0A292YCX9_9BACL|nr:VOC family protein [Effusibacillus lacus]TCS71841.1 catechol 2,3-dioxygenase-like lactoylglutathione lyase family enzyme [Effusibacillus lacus]GAX89592.1 hypothetical protein EFBL_1216 [Effusibacillus lacus]